MEEPKKKCSEQEKKKMAIKIRKVSGGGIGAVILLGGALTTAALASAFLLRQKGRSSSKDRRRHHQNTPPPAVNELNNQNEQDEAKTGLQFILLDTSSHVQKHLRGNWNCSEATKEVESDNDTTLFVSTQSLTLDKKAGTEITGGIPGAVSDNEASEEILCSIGPKKLENDALSDEPVINKKGFLPVGEKLQFEPKNIMHEVKIGLSKEDVTNEISKESCGFKQVYIEEPAGGEPSCDGEFEGMNIKETVETTEIQPREEENCDQEESEVMTVDNALDGVHTESDQMEYEKNLCKTFKNEENVNGDEKEVALPTETLEIIQEDEAIGGGQEEKIKHIEEQLVEEHGQWDQPDEEIVPEICEEVGWTDEASRSALQSDLQTEGKNEEKIPCEKEENACIFNPTTEDRHLGDYDKNVQIAVPMPKEELVIPEDIEVTKDSANEEVAESLELNENKPTVEFVVCHQKGHEDVEKNMGMEVEESSETIDKDTATTKDDLIIETSEDNINNYNEKADKEDLYDKVEDSSVGTRDSSMESHREAIWQAESLQESSMEPQQVKLIDQEVGGKIQEDTAIKEGKHDFQDSQITGGDSSSKLQVKAAECASQKSTEIFPIMADSTQFTDGTGNSEKTFIEKYVVELAKPKDHSTNSTWWRMLIWTLFVMSLPSCSWFFGLSLVKLCLIVFFTMVLSNLWVLNSRHA